MYTRRRFLAATGSAAACAAVSRFSYASGPGANVFSPQSLGHYLQGTMTAATFERVLGSVFTAFLSEGVAYLRLTAVTPFGGTSPRLNPVVSRPGKMQLESAMAGLATAVSRSKSKMTTVAGFELAFAVQGSLTEQGTYLLDHGRVGRLALFLVPGQRTCTAMVITEIPRTA